MFTQLARGAVVLADRLAQPHGLDRYLELVDPTWVRGEVRGRITHVRRQTPRSVTLTIATNAGWTGFAAGQHTQLSVEIDGVRHTRCYSMANAATGDNRTIELTVTAHPNGVVSQHLVANARPGMVVGLTPAQGEFTLPQVRPERLLFISGGSGITPVLSMLRTLCAEGHRGPITFLYYALTRTDSLYVAELDLLARAHPNVSLVRVFTEQPGAGDLDGFLTPAQLHAAEPHWRHATAYVCGPAPLMDAARSIYEDARRGDQVHTEAFTLPAFLSEAGHVAGTLRLSASRLDVPNDGRPVLAQAESAGLTPTSGCRMGICHTCVRELRCGTVRNVITGQTTAEPGAEVRICVNAPVGDVDIDL